MHEYQELVLEFHKKFGLTYFEDPIICHGPKADKDAALRVNLIMEETRELFEAAIKTADKPYITDCLVGVADACADLLYVIYGAGLTFGIALNDKDEKRPSFLLGFSHMLVEPSSKCIGHLIHFGMEANRKFAEAVINKDLLAIEKSLSNLLDYTYAVSDASGIKIDFVFREVQRSNMSKLWPGNEVKRRESDGKILKPPTYSPADIKGILSMQ